MECYGPLRKSFSQHQAYWDFPNIPSLRDLRKFALAKKGAILISDKRKLLPFHQHVTGAYQFIKINTSFFNP